MDGDDDFYGDDVGHHDQGFGLDDAVAFGTGYAFLRHGQDVQTRQIINAIHDREPNQTYVEVDVRLHEDQPTPPVVNALDFALADMPESWDEYIGQEALKQQIQVYIKSAQVRGESLPHTLLASGYPGVGKTTLARLIAKTLGKKIIELVPPFNIHTLVAAAQQLDDGDVLFIDEIHKLSDNGARGAEILLKVLEDLVAYMPDGSVIPLNKITVIGATTDRDKLPETVVDRFKIKPYFGAYTPIELACIALTFAGRHDALNVVDDDMAWVIGNACRGTPRITEEMVMGCKALADAYGRPPTAPELLAFMEVEPDGLTRVHIHYLTSLFQYFARETKDGTIEYIVGEAAMQQILRETKQGIGRVERFMVERGLVDRTPRGRRLTALGIAKARYFISIGKGSSDVA